MIKLKGFVSLQGGTMRQSQENRVMLKRMVVYHAVRGCHIVPPRNDNVNLAESLQNKIHF